MATQANEDTAAQGGSATPPRARRSGQRLKADERKAAQDKFLLTFAATANVAASCLQAEIDRSTVYKWLEHDEPFTFRYHQAEQDALDVIRAAIQRRGIEGVEEHVLSQGKVVFINGKPLMQRRYSDACLLAMAKARVPEYREKVDLNVQGSVTHDYGQDFDPQTAGIARELVRRLTAGGDR
jgi:hypothetical protein